MSKVIVFLLALSLLLSACSKTDKPAEQTQLLPAQEKKTVVVSNERAKKTKKNDWEQPVAEIPREQKKKRPAIIKVEEERKPLAIIHAEKSKKMPESVTIGSRSYPVPRVWRGTKITTPSPPDSRLVAIPVEYTHRSSQIFIEKDACRAFIDMARAAGKEGIHLKVDSGYRSVRYQRKIFENLMAKGRTWDDLVRYVAPPGYSEHALGTVVDLYPSDWQFAQSSAYSWLQKNARRFGFRETYPQHSPGGFPWEAWHWRYMGDALNTATGKTSANLP